MNFRSYSRLNNIVGWLIFAISAFTYLSTIEHTVSLWDCGEFIPSSFKLEVPHPPGAPFFILLYRLFAMVAPNHQWVAILTNSASALASAFTILFLFWTVTALAFKMLVKDEQNIDKGLLYAILGAGAVGSLAYNFSDTFWFSAVESEVYALSSMFTALVFWLALKWERRSDQPHHLQWMVLIFYMIGIVIGVHLLGLLVIPAVILLYYYRKYPNPTWKGAIVSVLIGFVALALVQFGTIQGLPAMASWFELMFVNSFGLPFWSGVIFFFILLFGVFGYFIYRTHKSNNVLVNTALVCFTAVIIGYSSYALCVVRSYANPPIDMNDTEDVFSLLSYLSREQYGDNYLVSGPYYTAYRAQDGFTVEDNGTIWAMDKENHKYVEAGTKRKYNFSPEYTTIFPRMFNGTQENYINGYKYWGDIKNESKISFVNNNLRFFFSYQMRYMYWRYFAWNFIGRQNDIQGIFDEVHQGNWITGIPFIDSGLAGAGPQDHLPPFLKDNRARNKLFALPFLLGLLGFFFQYKRDKHDFWVTVLFFFMTGLAIALYLNMPSPQPRERDYAFVGSFYVFAIWIGLGVLWIYDRLLKRTSSVTAAGIATALCLVAVPAIMAAEEWDDHDRSHRTASLDYGVNYLESCAKNAVLFTNGDNDTYPLWYAQEVEGIRDDIRIVNLSLFGTDWYINQMRRPINHAAALTFTLSPKQTEGWDYIQYNPGVSPVPQDVYVDLKKVIQFIGSDAKETKMDIGNGEMMPYLPTKKLSIPIDKGQVLASGTVSQKDAGKIVSEIDFDIKRNNLMKSDVMVLDFIATNNWRLPIYFSVTSGPDEYLYLGNYLQQEGLAYRLVPVKNEGSADDPSAINSELMYNNMMTKFRWGKLDKNNTLVDYVLARQCQTVRGLFLSMCMQLLNEGQTDKAIKAADKALEVVPEWNVPYDVMVVEFSRIYWQGGQKEKANKIANRMITVLDEELSYYGKISNKKIPQVRYNVQRDLKGLETLAQYAQAFNESDISKKIDPIFNKHKARFAMFMDQQ